jgi:hypothetical protein
MDYKTKPVKRKQLREYSKSLRRMFNIPLTGAFPVLEALERLSDVFPGSNFEIVEDDYLPLSHMAECSRNETGGYTIRIKESIYNGAYEKSIGAYRGFICHEICHVFLFSYGYVPVENKVYRDGELPAYCSVEWQTKALCAETMIPYDESSILNEDLVESFYNVSKSFAKARFKCERR